MRPDGAVVLRFADVELDLNLFELRRGGIVHPVEPQVFDVLAYLFRHHDRVVSKGELLDSVWGDRFVNEATLSSRIKAARRAVGDDGRRQDVIRTVHGRGFRVVAEVEVVTHGEGPAPQSSLPGRPLRRRTSSFIGRDGELRALTDVVGAARVLTICGPGGIGKTRLAIELAARVAHRYPQAPRLIELSELERSADVADAVAATVGVQAGPRESVLDRLVDVFAHQRMLLVLDNCEHVVDGAAALVLGLVEGGDAVDVIATSRSPLHVDGERIWALGPLSTEATGDDLAPAVRLFLDRACALPQVAAAPGLDRSLVQQACERVDGIPLCLELAASRVWHVGLEAVVAGLDDPATLRAIGGRAERHASLESVIAWSYDRLPAPRRRLFERLSVFAGRFDARAAHHVAGTDSTFSHVVDEISELVDRSLVAVDLQSETARYSLLTPLRNFARRKLEASDESWAIRGRHARWAIEVAEDANRRLRGPGAAAAMARFDGLVPELRLAQRALVDRSDLEGVAALCRSVFWFGQQGRVDVLSWAQEVLDRRRPPDVPGLAALHASAGVAAWQRGDVAAAGAHAEAAMAAAEEPVDRGLALLLLAEVRQLAGEHAEAVAVGASIAQVAAEAGDQLLGMFANVVQALSFGVIGDIEAAQRHAGAATDVAEACGSALARAWASYAEGEVRLETSSDVGLAWLEKAWSLARAIGAGLVAGAAGLSVVSLRARRREPGGSLADFAEVIDHWARAGIAMHQWATIRNLVEVLAHRDGADEDSARLYGSLSVAGRSPGPHGAEAARLERAMGAVERRMGSAAFNACIDEGAALADSALVAYARSVCDSADA